MVKAVFFDKDGVLCPMITPNDGRPSHGAWNMKEVEFMDGSKSVVRQIQDMGYLTFMITNQPDPEVSPEFLREMMNLCKTYFCFDDVRAATTRGAPDYKPNNSSVLFLAHLYSIELSQSFFVGDRWRDIVCGDRSGMKTVLLQNDPLDQYNSPQEYAHIKPDYTIHNLNELCNIIGEN